MDKLNQRQVARNVAIHDRIARRYEAIHGEIFNPIEQDRLRGALEGARDLICTGEGTCKALDFGCGSGNLTRHLLDLGMDVTSADVSRAFLDLVASRYPKVTTHWMEEGSTAGLADCSFDLVATYSVLHHIPDYLAAVGEMARVCKPGGVVVIDHEPCEAYWGANPEYVAFRRAALRLDWRKYLTPSNYLHRLLRVFDPRHSNEGDIHVWPDDHIEWDRVKAVMGAAGFEVAVEEDYLLYRSHYRQDVYERYAGRCADMKAMVFRKLRQ